MTNKSIVLIGMSGVGKSTIGHQLSIELNYDFIDLDRKISEAHHQSIQDIINTKGEAAFIKIEGSLFKDIPKEKTVIAPGGSIIYSQDILENNKSQLIYIYLKDTIENIQKRITNEKTRGIIGLNKQSLEDIYNEREPKYASMSHITIDCHHKHSNDIIKEINNRLP